MEGVAMQALMSPDTLKSRDKKAVGARLRLTRLALGMDQGGVRLARWCKEFGLQPDGERGKSPVSRCRPQIVRHVPPYVGLDLSR